MPKMLQVLSNFLLAIAGGAKTFANTMGILLIKRLPIPTYLKAIVGL
jgi:hypothetical protein